MRLVHRAVFAYLCVYQHTICIYNNQLASKLVCASKPYHALKLVQEFRISCCHWKQQGILHRSFAARLLRGCNFPSCFASIIQQGGHEKGIRRVERAPGRMLAICWLLHHAASNALAICKTFTAQTQFPHCVLQVFFI